MKKIFSPILLICLLACSCEKDNNSDFNLGEGIELYLTQTPYIASLEQDYSQVDFDTILLENTPMLRYNQLVKYDTANHKLTLAISHDSLKIGDAAVYGRMFVLTIDKEPVYCGFYWPLISSIPCLWVFIEEPYYELDGLADNEIMIRFNSQL
ncbi:MAG: hypothetical protein CVU09_00850 [Bacteroidetes bacterium HGW-Bacteroidetes-4]|jgi:hypothetical protein|nr:MAG: hypothetical protein CVU09_00850 [Bacteroidetes bacterium HGW-Bacteroidetes-4]